MLDRAATEGAGSRDLLVFVCLLLNGENEKITSSLFVYMYVCVCVCVNVFRFVLFSQSFSD